MAGQPGRSGGPRVGTPGKTYTNRTDLNTQRVMARPSQQYGERAAAEQAQRDVPLPAMPLPGDPTIALGAPTTRPDEPVTAGLPFGDGPGPEVLRRPPATMMPDEPDEGAALIRALAQQFRYPELIELVKQLDGEDF